MAKRAEPVGAREAITPEQLREFAGELAKMSALLVASAARMERANHPTCLLRAAAFTGPRFSYLENSVARMHAEVDVQVSAAERNRKTRIDYSQEEIKRRAKR